MKKNIHFFNKGEAERKPQVLERIGIRGRLAMELADLSLPILPGFVIDADVAAHLDSQDLRGALAPWLERLAKLTGKSFGGPRQPHAPQDRRQPEPRDRHLSHAAQLRPDGLHDRGLQQVRRRELRLARDAVPGAGQPGDRAGHRGHGGPGEGREGLQAGDQGAGLRAERPDGREEEKAERGQARRAPAQGLFRRPVRAAGDRPEAHQPPAGDQRPEPGGHGPSHPAHGVRQLRQGLLLRPVLYPQHRDGRLGHPGRVFPGQVQRHRRVGGRYQPPGGEVPRGPEPHRAQGGRPLQGDPLHPVHRGEQEAVADRPALGDDEVDAGRHPPAPGPARPQARGRHLGGLADQAGSAERDPAPHHRLCLREGAALRQRRHHRRAGRGHRPRVLLHGEAAGRAQAGAAEGAGHEDDPVPSRLLRRGRQGDRGGHGRALDGGRLLGARLGRGAPVRQGLPREAGAEDPRHPGAAGRQGDQGRGLHHAERPVLRRALRCTSERPS